MEESRARPTRDLQLEETLARDADLQDDVYPYAALLDFRSNESMDADNNAVQFADSQTMQRVREAVRACSQGKVQIYDLRAALNEQLTVAEQELAFVELNKHVDLHQTLVDLNEAMVRRDGVWAEVARYMIQRTVEGHDWKASAGRSAVSVVGDVVGVVACGVNSVTHFTTTNAITNSVVCLILSSVDVYRWSKGEISASELACNIGEHVTGCTAALGGSILGAANGAVLGTAVGGPLAPVTMVLGALLGGFLADFLARQAYRSCVNKLSDTLKDEETEDEARQRAINEAATTLGVNLQRDGFALAKSKFRRRILESHPDRAAHNKTEDQESAARVIAAWQIVRGQYEMRDELDDGDGRKEPEAFIVIWVMKTRQTANGAWRVARTWFGEMQNAPVHRGQLEMVERHMVYM